jgi:hypothetical protein
MKQKITLTGIDLSNYQGIDPFRDVDRTYRSVDEAFKGAEYACAIHRHTPDWRHAVRFFSDFFAVIFWAGCAITLPIALVVWLIK